MNQLKLKEVDKIIRNLEIQIDSFAPEPYEATLEQLGYRMHVLRDYRKSLE